MTWQIGDVIHFLVAVWNWFIVATVRSCVSEGYLGWWMRSRNEWEKFSFRPFECANFLATSHFSPSIFHSFTVWMHEKCLRGWAARLCSPRCRSLNSLWLKCYEEKFSGSRRLDFFLTTYSSILGKCEYNGTCGNCGPENVSPLLRPKSNRIPHFGISDLLVNVTID